MLLEQNMGRSLSIDETAFANEELYTIVTNKEAKGRKGSIVAMIKGTQADQLTEVLKRIPKRLRRMVEEMTLDMAASMNSIKQKCP